MKTAKYDWMTIDAETILDRENWDIVAEEVARQEAEPDPVLGGVCDETFCLIASRSLERIEAREPWVTDLLAHAVIEMIAARIADGAEWRDIMTWDPETGHYPETDG